MDKRLMVGCIAVIFLSISVLMGLAIVGTFTDIVKTPTLITDESLGAYTTTETLAHNPIVSGTTFLLENSSGTTVSSGLYTLDYKLGKVTLTTAGNASFNGQVLNATYYYGLDNSASAVGDNFTTGLGYFALFVGILIIALVGKVIIDKFKDQ